MKRVNYQLLPSSSLSLLLSLMRAPKLADDDDNHASHTNTGRKIFFAFEQISSAAGKLNLYKRQREREKSFCWLKWHLILSLLL